MMTGECQEVVRSEIRTDMRMETMLNTQLLQEMEAYPEGFQVNLLSLLL